MSRFFILLALLCSTSASAQTIGPNFGNEIIAAGLGGLPFSWSSDGTIRGLTNLTPAQQTTLNAVLAAHNPNTPAVPQVIGAMNAKVALSRAGLLASVQTWVNTQSAERQLIWNTATDFRRDSPLIAAGAAALGLTSAQLDQLFITAATIQP
jgi:hypothetical protein